MEKGRYRHYKGGEYEVIDFGIFEPTLEEVVIYKQLHDSDSYPAGTVWVRPQKVFEEEIGVEGKKMRRFRPVD